MGLLGHMVVVLFQVFFKEIFVLLSIVAVSTPNNSARGLPRLIDTKVVVHIYSGILLSYKKKCILVSLNEVDERRAYYTQ